MDFALTKSQIEIQKAVKAFAKGEFDKDMALELEKKHEFPKKIWKKAADLGFIGIHFDEKYSGQGLGVLENIIIAEGLCSQDSTIGAALSFAGFGAECLLRSDNEKLKQTFLPRIAEGVTLSAIAHIEADQNSDMACLNTTAVQDGNEWVINGTKSFVTNGCLAGFFIVLCQTDPGNASPHSDPGAAMILVEADRKGITAMDIGNKVGMNMISMATVGFNDVRVPLRHLIGDQRKGHHQLQAFFNESRILIAAQSVGMAQGAFDRALTYVKQREQFGKRIADFQITRHKLAEMATQIEIARLLTYKAAWHFDKGDIDPKQASMAKMVAARIAVEVADEAIQLLGGYGYMMEYEVERFYRDAKVSEIHCGNPNIQKEIIADAVLRKSK